MAIEVTVTYWIGNQRHEGKAKTYLGAKRIASRPHAYDAKFWHGSQQLMDENHALWYFDAPDDMPKAALVERGWSYVPKNRASHRF